MTDRADLPARLRSNALVTFLDKDTIATVPPTNAPLLNEAATRIEVLEAALKPFAEAIARYDAEWAEKTGGQPHSDGEDEDYVCFLGWLGDWFNMTSLGDFRRARSALTPESSQ